MSKSQTPKLNDSKIAFNNMIRQLTLDEAKAKSGLNMAAYEGCLSRTARSLLGSPLAERYHLGLIGDRFDDSIVSRVGSLSGMSLPGLSSLEIMATTAAKSLFDCQHVDFRPLSGIHATLCIAATMSEPGDSVMSIATDNGGHHATQELVRKLGRVPVNLPWISKEHTIDISKVTDCVISNDIKLVIIDAGVTVRPLPVCELRESLPISTKLAYDASHNLGLIAGRAFPNPLSQGADVLFGNTHKSFPGPQKGILLFRDYEIGKSVSACVGDALISSQHTGDTAALYMTVLEMRDYGVEFARVMVCNAAALAEKLKSIGFEVLAGDTENMMSAAFWIAPPKGLDAHEACRRLADNFIFVNAKNADGRSLIRIGTQYVTRLGMEISEMESIAMLICKSMADSHRQPRIRESVQILTSRFSTVAFSYDSVMKDILFT